MKIREGYMDFKGLKTYWRVAGESDGTKKPIIFLHGGPGSSHNYFEVLDGLAEEGRELVMYDQIGCGKSPAPGRTDLFNRDVWVEELIALRKELRIGECHILGQSWGGMLLLEYVCGEHPEGIRSIILSSTLPSPLSSPMLRSLMPASRRARSSPSVFARIFLMDAYMAMVSTPGRYPWIMSAMRQSMPASRAKTSPLTRKTRRSWGRNMRASSRSRAI